MPRFDRVYSLVIGQGGQQGVEISNLRLTFDISKDDTKNPNRSRIRVYNLSASTRQMLEKPDVRCVFKAGYAEEDGPLEVYQGDVSFVFSRYELPDIVTEIELGEGMKAIRDSMVSLSYAKGVSSRTIINDLAKKFGLPVNMPNDVPVREWQNGLSYHGAARQALDKVCAATGLSWSIQGGSLQIIRSGGNTNRTVFDIGAESGLIGSPERIRKGKQEVMLDPDDEKQKKRLEAKTKTLDTVTQEEDGWRVRSLLLPTLLPGDRVKLSSRTIDGVFTIRNLRHFGDSHGGDWITELKIVNPTESKDDPRHRAPAPRTQVRQSNRGGDLPLPPPQIFPENTQPRLDINIPE